ncbi:LOB domain-containing protein 39-like isoform X2 [Vigna umbellata]|uniref:LOB domain-containing protein 39-like isoform X2 n=1 Tax=Vigna umbellata TaxID=87088 RepID=UPI001F5E621E|nr:LOB domain-containing protein 39-like isoform X2 [Vigna umbellata]
MSCNGCRVLRKGCSETCPLRSCLQWIESAESQRHATLFLAKFFGRTDLMSFIASVPQTRRPGCGRTVNPVNGAVGLLCSGNWHLCEAAVETVLAGGVLRAQPDAVAGASTGIRRPFRPLRLEHDAREMNENSSSLMNRAEEQETVRYGGHKKNQILNLFM